LFSEGWKWLGVGVVEVNGGELCHQWWRAMSSMVESYVINGGELCHQWWRAMSSMVESCLTIIHLCATLTKNKDFGGLDAEN